MMEKANLYIYVYLWLEPKIENYICEYCFSSIILLGQTLIFLDKPPTYRITNSTGPARVQLIIAEIDWDCFGSVKLTVKRASTEIK